MPKFTTISPRLSKWDARSPEAEEYRKLYWTPRWRGKHGVRARQLAKQPLCENCLKHGRYTPATVCDHVDPSKKLDPETFFDGPFQSLCDAEPWRCHSSVKQREELGVVPKPVIGLDGWPEGS